MTNFKSSEVSAGDTITAAERNLNREDILRNAGDYATTTGTANAYVLALDAQLAALEAGDKIRFNANFTNTGSATINVNAIGAVTFNDPDGNTLSAGDILSGLEYEAVYDGTVFVLISPKSNQVVGFTTAGDISISGVDNSETTLISQSILGHLLGTKNVLKITLFCEQIQFGQTNETKTFRLKYGATTLIAQIIDNGSFGSMEIDDGIIEIWLYGDAATNAQEGAMRILFTDFGGATLGDYNPSDGGYRLDSPPGAAAEDSTAAKTLEVSYQAGNSHVNSNFVLRHAFIELIKA